MRFRTSKLAHCRTTAPRCIARRSMQSVPAIAVVAVLVLSPWVTAQCPLGFAAPANILIGPSPMHVAAGDFNGDGRLDLAVALFVTPDSLAVVLGDGTGGFSVPILYAIGERSTHVSIGDFDNDLNMDLAVSNGNGVAISRGNGDGSFRAAVTFYAGPNPNSLVLADFNFDGKLDAYMGSVGTMLFGNGDGSLQGPVFVGATGNESVVDDFNNDGIPDIAGGNGGLGGGVKIMLGAGNGTFLSPVFYPVGPSESICVGDFDSNGTADVAVIGQGGGASPAYVLRGNGNGTFQSPLAYAVPGGAYCIGTADVDDDGTLDLLVGTSNGTDNSTSTVKVLRGNGNATFQSPVGFDAGGPSFALRMLTPAYDLNNDGRRDVVAVPMWGAPGLPNSVVLLSNGPLIPVSQEPPTNIHIQAGQALSLSVEVTAVPQPSFRWRRNGVMLADGGSISGATTANLDIMPALPQDSGSYSAIITAPCRTLTFTSPSIVTVECASNQGPMISQHPTNQTVVGGGSASFSVAATGTGPLAFHWRRSGMLLSNGGNISGANGPVLYVSPVTITDGGSAFDCVVTDSCGSNRSDPAGVQVITTTQCLGDFNNDGSFNGSDIQFIVDALLSGQACP